MIMIDKERKVKDSKITVKIRASIEMNVEVPENIEIPTLFALVEVQKDIQRNIQNQSLRCDDFEYEVLEIKNEISVEKKVNYTNKEI